MIHRISRRKYNIFALDIETHNDEESIKKQETSMWLGCLIDENSKIDDESSYFYSMNELIDKFIEMTTPYRARKNGVLQQRKIINNAIYIYNLSFEWSFLLPVLLERGYSFRSVISKEDEFVYSSISTKSVSSVWEVRIKNKKNGGIILLRDMSKLYGGGLGNVAKAFNLPTQKGEIDYRKNRLHNYTITKEEKEYCFKDTRIIIDILLKVIEEDDKDFFNSISMSSYSMRKLLKFAYPHATRPYLKFRQDYPILSQEESDFVRKGFSGGLCYAVEKYQFKEVKQVLHIDAKQMYPSMIYLKPHPYGEGEYFVGAPTKLFKHANLCHVKVSYFHAKLHSVISLIGIPMIEDRELYLWDFEIPTMRKIYEGLEIEYIDGYCYKTKFLPWRNYVRENFYKREQAKKKGDTYNVLRYKLLNNAGAYGKFVERPHNEIFENYINMLGIIDSKVSMREELKIQAKYTYIPLCSITAWARVTLIETALLFDIDNILYFDTDSIFCLYNERTKYVYEHDINLNNELGGWALEEISERAQFTAPKRYKIESKGKTTIKAGGINFDKFKESNNQEKYKELIDSGLTRKEALSLIEIPYDEINIVKNSLEVQRAYRVKGGTIIEFQNKTMDIQKKYIDIYKRNIDNNKG